MADVVPAVEASLSSLPLALLHDIVLRVPPAERLLFALVCRAARALVAEAALWKDDKYVGKPLPAGLLRRLSFASGDTMKTLCRSGDAVTTSFFKELLSVLRRSAATLTELDVTSSHGFLSARWVTSILHAAPSLTGGGPGAYNLWQRALRTPRSARREL